MLLVFPPESDKSSAYFVIQKLKTSLPRVVVKVRV